MRFEESLIKICIEKLEDSAKRINELRQMHVDENYEGDIKLLVAKEIREKIDEYYRVWIFLRNYFEEDPSSHAPDLDTINSILWLKDLNEKNEPKVNNSLTMEGMGFYSKPDDIIQRLDEDVNRLDLFKALKDIDIIDELNSEESSLLSFQEDATPSSVVNETTFTKSNSIKSFQDFYLRILDETGLTERLPPLEERPASPIQVQDIYVDTTSKEILDKINLMKQYRDYVDSLRPDLNTRVRADYIEYQEAPDIVPPLDAEAIDYSEPKEFNHKLKYYTIKQDPDSTNVSNHTPKLAVYHINGANEKVEEVDIQNNVEDSSLIEALEIGDHQKERMASVFSSIIADVSMIFGIILFTVGAYFTVTYLFSSSGIESTETIIQILYLLIDQLPGVPISVNYLRNFYDVYVGIVFLALGLITIIMSVGLMWKIDAALFLGTFLYIFSSIFDIIDILYFGSVGSPLNILALIINLLICGIFVKDMF